MLKGSIQVDVLLVEDSEDDALLIERALQIYQRQHPEALFNLRWAHNRPEFEGALNEQEWTVVVSDYMLPDISWPVVLAAVSARWPYTPVILISGKAGTEDGGWGIQQGAADFVDKSNLNRLGHVLVHEVVKAEVFRRLMTVHLSVRKKTGPLGQS